MANKHSYTITTENNKSEKEGIAFLIESDKKFIILDKDSRKKIMDLLMIEKKYSRAFDLILIKGDINLEKVISFENTEDIVLIELKTTKKKLVNSPSGFFFGATQSEFELAEKLGDKYNFCFVSLHPETKKYTLLTLSELNKMIKTKRLQYQINL